MLTIQSTITIAGQTVPQIIPVVQGDTGRSILFTLADFTIPQGSTATYYVQKPSGEAVYNAATIDGNTVLVELTAQSIIEHGDSYGQVRIENDGEVVTSFDFILLVKPFRGIGATQSTTEMNIFDKAVEQAEEAIDDAKDAALDEINQTTGNFAEAFSASKAYSAGEYVMQSGHLYRFTSNHAAGAWTGSDAEAVTVGEELTDVKDGLTAVESDVTDLKEEIDELSLGVPTNVRQAIKALFESAAYAETGLTDEMAVVSSWASQVTAISLNNSTISISGASTSQLVATTTPSGGTVTWTSSDTSVATVSSSGLVTGVSNGTAIITATSGDVSATCTATVSGFATLTSISAVYTQSGTVYDTDSLDSLKTDLVVTALYDDQTTATVTTYTLSGTLTEGTSTITVSYGGKTTTFNVTVTAQGKSDMDSWTDGVAYTDLDIVENEYVKSATGQFASYNGWSRTGFVYCEGASSITFPPLPDDSGGSSMGTSSAWYTAKDTSTRIDKIWLSKVAETIVNVPSNAKYFAISATTEGLGSCISTGIVPHA